MDSRSELMELLMATFVTELDERVQALNTDLLALEKHPRAEERSELLTTLFRSAHSLKGAARSVSLELIESACHALEDILTRIRDGRLSLDRAMFTLLFAAADGIAEAGQRLQAHRDLADSPLKAALPRLEQTAKGDAPSVDAKPIPTATAEAPASESTPAMPPTEPPPEIPVVAPPSAAAPAARPSAAVVAVESPATAPKPSPHPVGGATATVRIAADKLDALLAQSGELLVARRRVESRASELVALRELVTGWTREWRSADSLLRKSSSPESSTASRDDRLAGRRDALFAQQSLRLRQLEQDLERLSRSMITDARSLAQAGALLEEEVYRVRMLPFGEGCQGLERAVRDVAHAEGKEVELRLEGVDVEVDRSILEGLRDPLLHLVRNAVDHGLEAPAQRQAAGKPARARITVSAALRGSQMEVVVADDGRGLDCEAIRAQALRRNLPVPEDDRELARVLFLSGFSTAPKVTDISGRGVGLDVVKSRIESLRGSVDVTSEPGVGTRFILHVPLTLTTLPALLVASAGQTLALATAHVRSLVRFGLDDVRRVGGRDVLLWDGRPIPIASLAGLLGWTPAPPLAEGATALAAVCSAGDREQVLLIDEVLGEQVIVVKSLGARIRRLRHVSGATLLPSGAIAVLLNVPQLLSTAGTNASGIPTLAATPAPRRSRLLVVDDSLTTRTLLKSILESHAYDVEAAANGQDAWSRLQESDFDLVVSDVEMPLMDGFALTEVVRQSPTHARLPVVLVTSRESDEDRARGLVVGADAYLGKSGFDQTELLQAIRQLL